MMRLIMSWIKQRVKSLPIAGPFLVRAFRFFYWRLSPTRYPGSDLSRKRTLEALCLGVVYAYSSEVEGDLVEFGTMSGETAQAIARAMTETEGLYSLPPRRLYLFDSFEGLPEIESPVDQENIHCQSGVWVPGSCFVLTKERLRFLVGDKILKDRLTICDGWYKETVSRLPEKTAFAMIHVDCDLYQSTLDALDPLFARGQVSEGAIILFDDWNCSRASPSTGERRAWQELTEKHSIEFSDEGSYSCSGRKFIVHAYARKPSRKGA